MNVDLAAVRVLLCDADGNLFPSEDPAFVASTEVTNRLLADLGVERRFTPDELRTVALGKNFRATAVDLAVELGAAVDPALAPGAPPAAEGTPVLTAAELERRVVAEREHVSAYLAQVLGPDAAVREPLERLAAAAGLDLVVVSSSATMRLDACFAATGLDDLFPPAVRYSAEDSLPVPTSKPDPAIYAFAGRELGIAGPEGLAIEDSVTGVRSAVGAGFPVIGNVQFVAPAERAERTAALVEAGAAAVVDDWAELEALLSPALRQRAPAPARGR